MTNPLKDIEQLARALAPADRAKLADMLLESLRAPAPEEIQQSWDREIEARLAAYDRGETESYAAEDVLAEARRLAR